MKLLLNLILVILLGSVFTVKLQASNRKIESPKPPYFMMPCFEAYGKKFWQLEEIAEIGQYAKYVENMGVQLTVYYHDDKNYESYTIYGSSKKNTLVCSNIKTHIWILFPSIKETQDFLFNEIPRDWKEIGPDEFDNATGMRCDYTPICRSTPEEVTIKYFLLPQREGKPDIYAEVYTAIGAEKRGAYFARGHIYYYYKEQIGK